MRIYYFYTQSLGRKEIRLNTYLLPKPKPHRDPQQCPNNHCGDVAEIISGYLRAPTTQTHA